MDIGDSDRSDRGHKNGRTQVGGKDNEPLIKPKQVHKLYETTAGGYTALRGIDLAMVRGEFAGGLLPVFGIFTGSSTIAIVLALPIAVQEMVMALWFILKGFDPSAIAALSAE